MSQTPLLLNMISPNETALPAQAQHIRQRNPKKAEQRRCSSIQIRRRAGKKRQRLCAVYEISYFYRRIGHLWCRWPIQCYGKPSYTSVARCLASFTCRLQPLNIQTIPL